MMRNNQLQIEVDSLSFLPMKMQRTLKSGLKKRWTPGLSRKCSPACFKRCYGKLRPEMKKIAKIIRKAVFTSQPIILPAPCGCRWYLFCRGHRTGCRVTHQESGGDFDADHFLSSVPRQKHLLRDEDITVTLIFPSRITSGSAEDATGPAD